MTDLSRKIPQLTERELERKFLEQIYEYHRLTEHLNPGVIGRMAPSERRIAVDQILETVNNLGMLADRIEEIDA